MSARLPRGVNAYVAWTMDRATDVSCDASDNPNTLRYCDESGTEPRLGEPAVALPYRHELKFGGNLPLWYGFEVSAALQSYAGAAKNVFWVIAPGVTRYPSDCTVPGCTPNALVLASRFAGDPSVLPTGTRLVAPGERYLPRVNQLDFGLKRNFPLRGGRRIQAEFNIYNMLNDNAVLTELQTLGQRATTTTGSSLAQFVDSAPGGRPTGIMYPRIMRLAASMRF